MPFYTPEQRPSNPLEIRLPERPLDQMNPRWTYRQAAAEFLSIPFPSPHCNLARKIWFQNEVVKSVLGWNTTDLNAYGKNFRDLVRTRSLVERNFNFDSALWQSKATDYWVGIKAVVDAVACELGDLGKTHPAYRMETAFRNDLDELYEIDAIVLALNPLGNDYVMRLLQAKATNAKARTDSLVDGATDKHAKWLASLAGLPAVQDFMRRREEGLLVEQELTVERPLAGTRYERVCAFGGAMTRAWGLLGPLGVTSGLDRPRMAGLAGVLTPRESIDLRMVLSQAALTNDELVDMWAISDGMDEPAFKRLVMILEQWANDARVTPAEIAAVNPNVVSRDPHWAVPRVDSIIWHGGTRVVVPQPVPAISLTHHI